MSHYRVVAIPTEVAGQVRMSRKAPKYGFPTFIEVATGYGPCRHCLRTFDVGIESRVLFTYDPFDGIEDVPLPGPVFIHAADCPRYPETAGYPCDMKSHAAIFSGFARGQRLVTQARVEKGNHEDVVHQILQNSDVDYIEVRDRNAGCYDFRIERTSQI